VRLQGLLHDPRLAFQVVPRPALFVPQPIHFVAPMSVFVELFDQISTQLINLASQQVGGRLRIRFFLGCAFLHLRAFPIGSECKKLPEHLAVFAVWAR
jgi:hypothetical protein